MTAPLQQFFFDLQNFAADLRELLAGGRLRALLATSWHDLRRNRGRQLPLIFTVAVHLGALILSLAGPLLLSSRVRIPEIYRVELYNAVELPPETAPAPPAPVTPPAPAPPPVVAPVKVQVQPTPPPTPAPAALPKAVSLSPIKQRLLKEQEEREAQERQTRLLANRIEQIQLEKKQKEAEELARQAASQAVSKLANLYRTVPATTPAAKPVEQTAAPAPAAPVQSGSGAPSPRELEVLERYKARLFQHIKPNWQLPDLQNWDEQLTAVIRIKVRWDGAVLHSELTRKSADHRFDQYVKKAIDNSSPLPPLPMELDLKQEDIYVTFTPGGLR